ncbi:zeta toxin family protein [Candidatus Uhrbacteria bacterium]|nr:zeta toxin family protein [Candidatus Uhrbacteria bacterium]
MDSEVSQKDDTQISEAAVAFIKRNKRLKKKLFLLDGTFSNQKKCFQNIEWSLNKGRFVKVIYLYQDPFIAWEFTKRREAVEHRHVPKESFVEQFFAANRNVKNMKETFKEIQVWYSFGEAMNWR